MAGLLDGSNGQPGLLGNIGNALWAYGTRTHPDELQMRQRRQQILQSLGPNPSLPEVGNRLLQIGDLEGFRDITRMAEAKAQQDWNRTYQGGMLQNARDALNKEPEAIRTVRAAGLDPTSPEGRKAAIPRSDTPISATDKKAIFSAEDDVPRLESTIANIEKAKKLNPSVPSGFGASFRGQMAAKFPDWMVPDRIASPAEGEATAEWDQLMGQEAIQMMSETLKGASTDFEMKKFINIAADTSQPPKVREAAMDRFLVLANKELALRQRRSQGLREGTYFKPGGDAPAAPAPTGGATVTGDKPPVPGARRGKKPDGTEAWFITAPNGKHYLLGE